MAKALTPWPGSAAPRRADALLQVATLGRPKFVNFIPRRGLFRLKAKYFSTSYGFETLHRLEMRAGDQELAHGFAALPNRHRMVHTIDGAGLDADKAESGLGLGH